MGALRALMAKRAPRARVGGVGLATLSAFAKGRAWRMRD
jgi:hypothetical protein